MVLHEWATVSTIFVHKFLPDIQLKNALSRFHTVHVSMTPCLYSWIVQARWLTDLWFDNSKIRARVCQKVIQGELVPAEVILRNELRAFDILLITWLRNCLDRSIRMKLKQVCCLPSFAEELPDPPGIWVEKTLIKDLLHDYEKKARPVVDGVSPMASISSMMVQHVSIEFGLSIIQILELDENEQVLSTSMQTLYLSLLKSLDRRVWLATSVAGTTFATKKTKQK